MKRFLLICLLALMGVAMGHEAFAVAIVHTSTDRIRSLVGNPTSAIDVGNFTYEVDFQYAQATAQEAYNNGRNYTYVYFLRTAATGDSGTGKSPSLAEGAYVQIVPVNGGTTWNVSCYNCDGATSTGIIAATGVTYSSDWHRLGIAVSGTTVRVSIDDVLVGSGALTYTLTGTHFGIANYCYVGEYQAKTRFDNFQIDGELYDDFEGLTDAQSVTVATSPWITYNVVDGIWVGYTAYGSTIPVGPVYPEAAAKNWALFE